MTGLPLERDEKGVPYVSVKNWRVILSQDPVLSTARLNLRTGLTEWSGVLPPWRRGVRTGWLRDSDYTEAWDYLATTYDFRVRNVKDAEKRFDAAAERRAYDPIRDYVEGLPVWDGVERAETCLPGMPDDPDARRCLHLGLTGAIKRALEPGCEFEHMVILVGSEGVGKTRSVRALFRGWVTNLARFDNKDDEIRYYRAWCVMDDERVASLGAGTKTAELYKDWLSRRYFQGRAAFTKSTNEWPRAYVSWGATNDPSFLRAQEGNRRYLPIRLGESTSADIQRLQRPAYVDQVWAEAKYWYERGDRTYIDRDVELEAHQQYLNTFLDEGDDDMLARLQRLLMTPLPAEWNRWSLAQQCDWWQSHEEAGSLPGGVAAVASADERPSAGDPPTRYEVSGGAHRVDKIYSQQLIALLAPGVRDYHVASVRLMLTRELRRLGWQRTQVWVSGAKHKGYRPGPKWDKFVDDYEREAGLL